jgi:tetratricopeptide (TPR) repeat protein
VLHRDIKPGNLMLDVEGKLYVTDFGLARIEADAGLTMTGDLIGTLRYMSPEQALAKRVVIDQRADIYSLGATLYELLTLQPAFGEADRSELLKQIAFEEPKPLRKLDRQLPAELETIVLKAMEKNPDERYQSATDLANDLRAFLDDRPIVAKPPRIDQRVVKWSRRHQSIVFSAMAVMLLATLGSGIGVVMIWRERQRTSEALTWAVTSFADSGPNQQSTARVQIYQEVLSRNRALGLAEHESSQKLIIGLVAQYFQLGKDSSAKDELAQWAALNLQARKSTAPSLFKGLVSVHSACVKKGRYDQAIWVGDWVVQQSNKLHPPDRETLEWMNLLAWTHFQLGQLDTAEAIAEKVIKTLQGHDINDPLVHENALNTMGDVFKERQAFDTEEMICRERIQLLQTAIDTIPSASLRQSYASTLKDLSLILQEKGQYETAMDVLREARQVAIESGAPKHLQAFIETQLGSLQVEFGDYDLGAALLLENRSYWLTRVRNEPKVKANLNYAVPMELCLSIVSSHRGDPKAASDYYNHALELIANPNVAEVFEALRPFQPVPYRRLRERAFAMIAAADSHELSLKTVESAKNHRTSE